MRWLLSVEDAQQRGEEKPRVDQHLPPPAENHPSPVVLGCLEAPQKKEQQKQAQISFFDTLKIHIKINNLYK